METLFGSASFEQLRKFINMLTAIENEEDVNKAFNYFVRTRDLQNDYNIKQVSEIIYQCSLRNVKHYSLLKSLLKMFIDKYAKIPKSSMLKFVKYESTNKLNEIETAIKNDDVNKLQTLIVNTNLNAQIYHHDISTINDGNIEYSLIQLAMLYGSIRCFKFLYLNGCYDDLCFKHLFAEGNEFIGLKEILIGGNIEIFRIIEHDHKYTKLTYNDNDEIIIIRSNLDIFSYLDRKYEFNTTRNSNKAIKDMLYASMISYNYDIFEYILNKYNNEFVKNNPFHYNESLANFIPNGVSFNDYTIEDRMFIYLLRNNIELYPLVKEIINEINSPTIFKYINFEHACYMLINTNILANNTKDEIIKEAEKYYLKSDIKYMSNLI